MKITLLFPSDSRTQTIRGVVSFNVEHGSENTVIVQYPSGREDEITAIGLTVTGAEIQD